MSTEHQQYSTSNQMDSIQEYAVRRNMEIVVVYSDEGKSGLNIQGRDALARMISDVQTKQVDYTCILVFDVSRWGRFQDADESAHYEYICRHSGIAVHYCAEQFENDGTPGSTIIKTVKRAMAGEYSRELSSKVFQGACRLIQLGFKQGGTAGFGLRRMLVDHTGQQKGLLKMGEHKSIQTDRVILVPGPDEEVAIVRWIYEAFVKEGKSESEIAKILNERGVLTDFQRPWTRGTVHEVLTNEKYIGHNVYHRTSCKLKQKHVENPPEKWIRAENAFVGIIDPTLYLAAQGIILTRSRKLSNEEMLEKLRGVLTQHGRISGILIDEAEDLPSSSAFRNRFGSLVSAYRLIGYNPEVDYSFIEINRQIRQKHPLLMAEVLEKIRQIGATVIVDEKTDLLRVNDEWTVSVVLCRYQETAAGGARWVIRLDEGLKPDITIAARLDETNQAIMDCLGVISLLNRPHLSGR
jgi:DNA invertase Pin-like site-specific DNA recombinase